jgi:high-affinity iron transporter
MVWNLSKSMPEEGFPGIVFAALFGYVERLYLVQAVCYVIFLLGVGSIYLQPQTWKLSWSRIERQFRG